MVGGKSKSFGAVFELVSLNWIFFSLKKNVGNNRGDLSYENCRNATIVVCDLLGYTFDVHILENLLTCVRVHIRGGEDGIFRFQRDLLECIRAPLFRM